MRHALRTAPLFHKPNWYVVASIALLLSVGIFAIAFAFFRSQGKGVHGVYPVLSIVHVEPLGTGRLQTDLFAMRDGRVYKMVTKVGLLSFSKCKQATGVLPRQLFTQSKLIVASPEFQAIRSTRLPACPTGRQCWYVRAYVDYTYHCAAFSEDDKASPAFQKLVNWFNAVDNMDFGQLGEESDCSSTAPNYYEDWCGGKGLSSRP